MNICLLLPTLNEIDGMRWCIPKINRSLFAEIIVVDGGSVDGTVEFATEEGLKVVRQTGIGIADALLCGFLNTDCDAIVEFTPDGNSLPEILPNLCAKMNEGLDLVIVSRYLDGAKSEDDDLFTGFGNWMFTKVINIFFGGKYTDTLVGYRGISRKAVLKMELVTMTKPVLRQLFPRMNAWDPASSIRAARLKLKVAEIPGDEPKRIGGVRKMSIIKNGLGTVFQIIYDYFFFNNK
jgi:glycosyltransferase involved in cell wall biosynthesis